MDVVVHLAGKGNWKVDFEGTRRLLEAAQEAGVSHLVFISIVGIEKVPYALSKAKLASEDLIEHSGIPWSILRATQFHYLIDVVLNFLTRLPLVALVPTDLPLQPIAEEEVARRLVEIVQAGPSGRVPDIGGPQILTSGELSRIWLKQRGMHRAILPLWLPGKMARAMRQGGNTCPVAWQNGPRHAPGGQYLPSTGDRHNKLGSLAPAALSRRDEHGGRKNTCHSMSSSDK